MKRLFRLIRASPLESVCVAFFVAVYVVVYCFTRTPG